MKDPLDQNFQKILTELKPHLEKRLDILNTEAMEYDFSKLSDIPTHHIIETLFGSWDMQRDWETSRDWSLFLNNPEIKLLQSLHLEYQNFLKFKPEDFNPQEHIKYQTQVNSLGMREKKFLELTHIISILKKTNPTIFSQNFWEIGCGKGHLSYALAAITGNNVVGLDKEADFQMAGKKRINKFSAPEIEKKITYLCHELKKTNPEIVTKIKESDFLFGLHTCGQLSNFCGDLFFQSEAAGLLNFGCCYLHLHPQDFNQVNLSKFLRDSPFSWNEELLTMATHAHIPISPKAWEMKVRVKAYRFSLHELLRIEFGIQKRIRFGPSPKSLYLGDFSSYARNNLNRQEIHLQLSEKALNDFFQSEENSLNYKKRIACQIYRHMWGRLLELFLLADRAQHWKERGAEVNLKAYFPEEKSPRNLGILLLRT